VAEPNQVTITDTITSNRTVLADVALSVEKFQERDGSRLKYSGC
jgi:hypothetical protein